GIIFAQPYIGQEFVSRCSPWRGTAHFGLDRRTASEEVPIMSTKSTRGFAAMDAEKQRAIASKGGKAAHAKGTAHRFTPAEASEAGHKGGRAAHARGTAHRFTAEEAS